MEGEHALVRTGSHASTCGIPCAKLPSLVYAACVSRKLARSRLSCLAPTAVDEPRASARMYCRPGLLVGRRLDLTATVLMTSEKCSALSSPAPSASHGEPGREAPLDSGFAAPVQYAQPHDVVAVARFASPPGPAVGFHRPPRVSPSPFIGCYVSGRRPNLRWRDEVSGVPCGKKCPLRTSLPDGWS
jgi:hypothetical protein